MLQDEFINNLLLIFKEAYKKFPKGNNFLDRKTLLPSELVNKYLSRYAFRVLEITDCIIFQSKNSKEQYEKLIKFNVSKKPLHIIKNGTRYIKYENYSIKNNSNFGFPACVTSCGILANKKIRSNY